MKATDKVYPQKEYSRIQGNGDCLAVVGVGGLTVRDHVAIEAMKSLIIVAAETAKKGCKYDLSDAVEDAYKTADAMIEQSNK